MLRSKRLKKVIMKSKSIVKCKQNKRKYISIESEKGE